MKWARCNEGPPCELEINLTQDISACSKHANFFKQDGGTSERQVEQVTDPDTLQLNELEM
jgi:hypothetical protein